MSAGSLCVFKMFYCTPLTCFCVWLFVTRHSLVRAKGEVFVLLYVSLFGQRFLDNPRADSKFACGRTLVPDVSSPLLGVSGPRRTEKRGTEILSQWGIFAFWRFLSDISATRGRIHTKFYLCRDNVCRRAPSPVGSIGPGGGGGELKTQKNGGRVSFVHRTATISIFLSVAKCGPIRRAQTCAHSGVEPSRSAKAFL